MYNIYICQPVVAVMILCILVCAHGFGATTAAGLYYRPKLPVANESPLKRKRDLSTTHGGEEMSDPLANLFFKHALCTTHDVLPRKSHYDRHNINTITIV